jgi:hypothetical protein
MADTPELHIVDSEIRGQGGHNLSFARSICDAAHEVRIHVWADRETTFENPDRNVTIHRFFHRRFRKLQTPFLLSRLLKRDIKVLLSTASSADLFALNLVRRWRTLKPRQAFLFFHFLNRMDDRRKQRFYEKMARVLPQVQILAPAESVSHYFDARGFKNVATTPYPVNGSTEPANIRSDFDHLLVSGHLRVDKGASALADFVEYLVAKKGDLAIYFQGHEDSDRYTETELGYWQRITGSGYSHLRVFPCALEPADYRSLFRGAISLQLYNPVIFRDRASGAALDALVNGTPIVALLGSWNARLLQEYDAGVLVEDTGPEDVLGAVSTIIANYDHFRERALAAGMAIRATHGSQAILTRILAG